MEKKKNPNLIPLEELLKKFPHVETCVIPPKPKGHVAKFANVRIVPCDAFDSKI